MRPACPRGLTVDVVNGNIGTLRHNARTDCGLVQLGGVDIASESCGEEPVEKASHDETNHDQAENDDETGVEHQLGNETARRDLVDVSSVVALGEARNCSLEIAPTVKDEGSIFSALARKDGAEGGVDIIACDGGCMGGHVWCHVDYGPIEYEVIG